ncbi:MAG: chemotaxis protein CheW [Methanoregula sp.]|jgi:purine-binding chemotaxis protein CheW
MSLDAAVCAEGIAPTQKDPRGQIPEIIQVVEFLLSKEHYAINLFDVREVVEYTTITRLPDTPPFIRGIIDLRGEITTIVNLGQRLGVSPAGSPSELEGGRIIVLDEKITGTKTGILVDDVLSVSTFSQSDIDCSSVGVYNDDEAITGIIRKKVRIHDREISELLIWICISRVLNDCRQIHGK